MNRIEKSDTPFKENSGGSSYYKITYLKNGSNFIAWYRAPNTTGELHQEKPWKQLPEKWIFNE